jgi:Skp family chaperone for outer membrane proteins
MTKTSLMAALVLAAAVPAALAQDAAAPAKPEAAPKGDPGRAPKLAIIDMQRISQESLLGKTFQAQLEQLRNEIEAERTKKQTELAKIDASIKTLQDEIEKQGSVLSPEAADKKRQEVVKKTRDRQAFVEDSQADLQRMQERAQQQAQGVNNEFQIKIKPQIDAVVKEKGIDILFDSQAAVFLSRDFDISRDVIVKSDDLERAAKGKAGAAAAPNPKPPTPNPPAPPKP